MNITLFGATGTIGQRILREALQRGHHITAVVRDPSRIDAGQPHLQVRTGNVLDPSSIEGTLFGEDVVISAIGPDPGQPQQVVDAANCLIAALLQVPVRLIVVGGAGSLEVDGRQIVDMPDFPESWKPIALAHRDALEVYRRSDIDWTCVSPAATIEPGQRTGKYRTAGDQLVVDEKGESRISAEDFAVAILDEAEHPHFRRTRFTVAY